MKQANTLSEKVIQLIDKGVKIPEPFSVEIGEDIDIDRISGDGTVFHAGTKIYGARTLISSKTKLGYESPVTVVNCQLGSEVELKGGYFKESVFLEKANMAYGAQVREGCILEEEANGSHTVGLKQTILFPFVTLGSLINFCDCFMAGGTSRKNHSEVGSSYIHFNYTPNQDKATASLIGDVPRGVMLNQQPIFLGGQGGLVGPARIGYGTVIAAGMVYRGDCPDGGILIGGNSEETYEKYFHPGFYGNVQRRVLNNIIYLANLLALQRWYIHVREPFFRKQELGDGLFEGALEKLEMAVSERLKRFEALSQKMEQSIQAGKDILQGQQKDIILKQQAELLNNWASLKQCFLEQYEETVAETERVSFLQVLHDIMAKKNTGYTDTIQALDTHAASSGVSWLQSIVDGIVNMALDVIPSYKLS
jgi:bifunctional UDP-N-acetylglucosamine pyrophosphorylase/glucosamine-1-phosphate N-acetyltransferase